MCASYTQVATARDGQPSVKTSDREEQIYVPLEDSNVREGARNPIGRALSLLIIILCISRFTKCMCKARSNIYTGDEGRRRIKESGRDVGAYATVEAR